MTTALKAIDMSLPVQSLETYIHWAYDIPMLTDEEEKELTQKLYDHDDLEAARRLVLAHLRFVIKIARGYLGYGLPHGDLIQEGNVGLMKAVKKFDPKHGVRLVSYAVHWIKAEIHDYIMKNWRIVKMATTKAQRKLFFNLRKMKGRLGWANKQEVDDIANELGVTPEEVLNMERRMSVPDAPFSGYGHMDDDAAFAPEQYLEDNQYEPSQLVEQATTTHHNNSQLYSAIQKLDPRSQDILQQRWLADGTKATLHDLAAKYSISAERVRQIEVAAMKKIKKAMVLN